MNKTKKRYAKSNENEMREKKKRIRKIFKFFFFIYVEHSSERLSEKDRENNIASMKYT